MSDNSNNTTDTADNMVITQEICKSTSFDDMVKLYGEPSSNSPSAMMQHRGKWKKVILGADFDLLDPVALAKRYASLYKGTHVSRKRGYTNMRGLIRSYLCRNMCIDEFKARSHLGYDHLGGAGKPCLIEDDAIEESTGVDHSGCIEGIGEDCADLSTVERRRRERDMAFVLYSAPLKWKFQHHDGGAVYDLLSPLPNRSKDLVLGIGKGKFGNYIDTSREEWRMVVRDFKTSHNGADIFGEFKPLTKTNRLRSVNEITLTAEVQQYMMTYLRSVPKDSTALFPLATGMDPYADKVEFAKAEVNMGNYILHTTKIAQEGVGQLCCGVSAMRASFVQFAAVQQAGTFCDTADAITFMACLAHAMRHSIDQQVFTYLPKKQFVSGKGLLDVVPWSWIQSRCSDIMAYRT